MTPPSLFIVNHLPIDSPHQQFISPPATEDEFRRLPFVSHAFISLGLRFLNCPQNLMTIDRNTPLPLEFNLGLSKICRIKATMNTTHSCAENATTVQVDHSKSTATVSAYPPSVGEWKLEFFGQSDLSVNAMPGLCTVYLHVESLPYTEPPCFCTQYAVDPQYNFSIRGPLLQNLPLHQSQDFGVFLWTEKQHKLPKVVLISPRNNFHDLHPQIVSRDQVEYVATGVRLNEPGSWRVGYQPLGAGTSYQVIASYTCR
ncbi:hypothetical protein K493DRAFT_104036 [Basidiobolus meristosporus CBS 931.73]|uniref:KY-like immunoglobulin-like domain-containing protein n=1 Tax=Basidiobolus meristosporus CBS 931.73 TaxID=1314790 RepID=A0A1Y1YR93_9FUNG|nr:hypothetical protein K493DRAFT_104036 [Basidiobolus meristosporus CBS 931.73]|eukprot:ORY00334.1 hypothetical protein K493DRAFT_104036 [Basidiobolus meristosporus CBS 931.73]